MIYKAVKNHVIDETGKIMKSFYFRGFSFVGWLYVGIALIPKIIRWFS